MFEISEVRVHSVTFPGFVEAADYLEKLTNASIQRAIKRLTKDMSVVMNKVIAEVAGNMHEEWAGTNEFTGPGDLAIAVNNPGDANFGLASIARSVEIKVGNSTESYMLEGKISTADLSVWETGGVIKPVNREYLSIPLDAAKVGGRKMKMGARQWGKTFVATSRRGNLIVFRKESRQALTPLYLLRKEVTVPARLQMSRAVNNGLNYFEQRMLDAFAEELEK